MLVGYARVSTSDQDLTIQVAALTAAGCSKVFMEKLSGTTADRPQLQAAMQFVREGDTLVVTRLDRFARSAHDLHNLIHSLIHKDVGFRCTEQAGIDTTTSMGKLLIGVLASVAEFETDIRKERQREGIEQAKAKGVYKGRRASIDPERVNVLLGSGMTPSDVARTLDCNRASVYRIAAASKTG